MPPTSEVIDITGHPLIPLEKNVDGSYPYPRTRYGISPYYVNDKNEIVWGWIKSNRVEPITFEPAAGTQDIIVIKGGQRLVLEAGKPIPDFNYKLSFLQSFIGQSFREKIYQDTISCLVSNGFSVYLESPLATAIHEAYEEHGIDLRKNIGRDNQCLKTSLELTSYKVIPPQTGVTSPLCLWLPELTKWDGIVLRCTNKIDKKMRRNFGREFYENGTWITFEYFKTRLIEEKAKFSSLDTYTPVKAELITEAFRACDRNMKFLEQIELFLKKPHQDPLENPDIIFSSQPELAPASIMSKDKPTHEEAQKQEVQVYAFHLQCLKALAAISAVTFAIGMAAICLFNPTTTGIILTVTGAVSFGLATYRFYRVNNQTVNEDNPAQHINGSVLVTG